MASAVTARPVTYFHVHVRKCGGSTFHREILGRNFGTGAYRDSSLIDYQYSAAQVLQILENCPWLRAYSSHKVSLDLPYENSVSQIRAITFVRDPIQRFVSHYFYLRNHSKAWDPEAKRLSIDEYIRCSVDSGKLHREAQMSQLVQLTGSSGQEGLVRLDQYLRTEQVCLFPLERFDEACLLLERVFPADFKSCHYQRVANRSKADQQPTDKSLSVLSEQLDAAEFELHSRARDWIDRAIIKAWDVPSMRERAMIDFHRRCRPPIWRRWWSK